MGSRTIGRASPSTFPPEMKALFEELTLSHSRRWGLEAAILMSRYRKRNKQWPTFAELFAELTAKPELSGVVGRIDQSTLNGPVGKSLRYHAAVQWRRDGWIHWSYEPRSLRPGFAFTDASIQWRSSRRRRG